jgi:predicted unusual protein kinase regulating ubiquinone biosynthesis (AarF/ABC1/UbiB family)
MGVSGLKASALQIETITALSEQNPSKKVSVQGGMGADNANRTYRWNRESYPRWRRSLDIWSFVLRLSTSLWLDGKAWSYPQGRTVEGQSARRRRRAIWIRQSILHLGPTFIKVGQLFSTRADLFPSEYVEELSQLQDQVPAFDFEQVAQILQQDLGCKLTEIFRRFDPVPLAAASLGQVHRAQLHSGEEVVVKVQRPGLRQLFEVDLGILKSIAHYFQRHPRWGRGRDWLGIYAECSRILWQEIDYLREGRNADSFRRNFQKRDWVKVPKVYWRYSAPRTLTLEYLPGIKISQYEALEAAGIDRQLLARRNAEAYLQQVLDDGFFHADPHPGNLAVSPAGDLIFYDFGMMGSLRSDLRLRLNDLFMAVARQNPDQAVQALIELGVLQPTGDLGPVRRSLAYLLKNFVDKPFEAQSITAISDDLYEIAYDQPFRFPATFTFVMRAFSTLEGVGKGLDPSFNFLAIAQPYAFGVMNNGSSLQTNLLNELSRQAAEVSSNASTALSLPRRLETALDKLDQGDLKFRVKASDTERLLRRLGTLQQGMSFAILTGSFAICSTILLSQQIWIAGAIALLLTLVPGIAYLRLMLRFSRSNHLP